MAWLKADDRLHSHRKTRHILRSAAGKTRDAAPMGLWILAGTWAAQNNGTGWIPCDELDRFDDDWEDLAERLVAAGYWWPEDRNGETGYGFVNWERYNPTPASSSASGSFGNHKRWHETRGKVSDDCEFCPKEPDRAEDIAPDNSVLSPPIAPRLAPTSPPDRGANRESSHTPHPNPTPPDPTPPLGVARDDDTPSRALALIEDAPAVAVAPKTTKGSVGTRLPDGWVPERTPGNLGVEEGHAPEWLSKELARFRDHFAAAPGQKGVRLDWDSTWRNWLRKAEEYQPRNTRPKFGGDYTDNDWAALADRLGSRTA